MNEFKTLKIHSLLTAVSPLTHMMGVAGNESVINRTKVFADGRICDVPVISGNAIRHSLIREPGAMFVVKTCGLEGKLSIDTANYLFYGGSLTESSAIAANLTKIAAMQELLPLYRLLGGSLRNQVISGSLLVSMGSLVCEENREILQHQLPEELLVDLPELRSSGDFVSNWQYTRGDASRDPEQIAPDDAGGGKSNLMIYGGQHIIPGAVFYHNFVLQNVSALEVGALVASIKDWQAGGGIIGGMGRAGHGKMDIAIYANGANFFGDSLDLDAYESAYRQHTQDKATEIVGWLEDAFPVQSHVGKGKTPAKAAVVQTDWFGAVPEAGADVA